MASQLTATGASLLYRSGAEKNYPLPDRSEIHVGYEGGNDVVVPFEGVSRRHAKISFDGKSYWIEDAGSANNTFLNGHRVAKRERLEHLDVVTLGRRTDLIFVRKRVSSRVTRRGVMRAWLERLDGLEAGEKREIPRGSLTIGRSSSNNIQTDSQLVSKVHARIERTPTQIILTDLHSANGTLVDGKRIETCVLKDGDEFTLAGARTYRVHLEEGEIQMNAGETPSNPSAFENPVLPTDWKTRIEWSTEERALLEIARSGGLSAQKTASGPAMSAAAAAAASITAPPPPRPPSVAEKPPAPAPGRERPPATAEPAPPKPAPSSGRPAAAAPPAPAAEGKKPPALPSPQSPAAPAVPAVPAVPAASAVPAPSAVLAAPAVPAANPLPRAFLDGAGKVFPLPVGAHEVGRLSPSAIQIDHPQISRRHAVIRVSEREIVVDDTGSSNGTFVNGERIRSPRVLTGGDIVAFGDVRFKVRIAGAS